MDKKLEKQVYDTIEEVMSIDMHGIDKNKRINTISEWDSFNNLMLISKFQDDLNVEFSIEDIEAVETLGALFKLIEKKAK